MPKGKRLARCIYQDAYGIRIVVERHGRRAEPRFPLGTPLHELADTRDQLIDELETGRTRPARTGTLAADIAQALATLPDGPHRRDTRTLLEHWATAGVTTDGGPTTLGALPRSSLTPMQVRTQLAVFRAATRDGRPRFRPKTVKELRRVLAWVFTTLDGADARNPVRAVKVPRVTYDDPRGIDYDVLERIFAEMPDRGRPVDGVRPTVSLSKLRMRVMAFTGMHQIEIGRLEPRNVDLAHQRVWIHPRIKGTGAHGAWHRLTARGVEALAAFVAAGAFGPFDPRSMARTWRLALRKAEAAWAADETVAGQPWPVHADARPYDLRHSLGTAVYLANGDIRAAQAILRHRQGSTTDRYTRAGVSRQVDAAVSALDAVFGRLPSRPTKPSGQDGPKVPPMSLPSGPPRARRGRGSGRKL